MAQSYNTFTQLYHIWRGLATLSQTYVMGGKENIFTFIFSMLIYVTCFTILPCVMLFDNSNAMLLMFKEGIFLFETILLKYHI